MSTWVPTSLENTSRFWIHMRLSLRLLTELDLYIFLGPRGFGLWRIFSFSKSRSYNQPMSMWVPSALANTSCFWFQVFASTFAYRAGSVYLSGAKGILTLKHFSFVANPYRIVNPWASGFPPTWTHATLFNSCVCLYFCLPSWICISLWDQGDLDSEAFFSFGKSISYNQPMSTWVPTFLADKSRFWFHMSLPLLLLTKQDLYIFLGPRGFGLRSIFLF